MAYLWHNLNNQIWVPTELLCSVVLNNDSINTVTPMGLGRHHGEVLLYSLRLNTQAPRWVLLAPTESRVCLNDTPLESGIRILADRDAIRLSSRQPIYFSTARLARIEEFPNSERVFCPRCKLEIAEHDASVCCPQCNVWHHEKQPDGPGCWSYAETCALCDQSTDLASPDFHWTPEEL